MKKLLLAFIAAAVLLGCNQNNNNQPPQQTPVQSSLDYTINDTLNISSQGVYYFATPSVACTQGGFQVSQPNVLNRSILIATFANDYSAGAVLIDSTNPACSFTKGIKIGIYEPPNKLYVPYQFGLPTKSWVAITQNSNGIISGNFHFWMLNNVNNGTADTLNVVGTFTDFNIIVP